MNAGIFGENFPYTNFHDLNLDWIIKTLKEIITSLNEKIKIADPIQWDITNQYPQYTIVLDHDIAYLSTKNVPQGIQISDREYWQPIFDFTQFFEMLEALNNKIDNETVKNNSTKHILFIGDSYAVWNSNRLFNKFKSLCGVPQDQVHSVAVSGASFHDASNSFLMQAQNYTGDKTQITDIIIAGGINDALIEFNDYTTGMDDTAVVRTPMELFMAYCRQNYPNAQVHLAYIGGTLPASQYYTTLHPALSQEWARWIYTIASITYGYHVLNTENAIHTSVWNYDTDKLHPSQTGCDTIAEAIASAFNGHNIIYNRPGVVGVFKHSGVNSNDIQVFIRISDDTLIISIPNTFLTISSNSQIGSEWFEILDLSDSEGAPQIRNTFYINVDVVVNNFSESTFKSVPASLRFEDGKVHMKILSPSGSVWETFTGPGTITLPSATSLTIPIWYCN